VRASLSDINLFQCRQTRQALRQWTATWIMPTVSERMALPVAILTEFNRLSHIYQKYSFFKSSTKSGKSFCGYQHSACYVCLLEAGLSAASTSARTSTSTPHRKCVTAELCYDLVEGDAEWESTLSTTSGQPDNHALQRSAVLQRHGPTRTLFLLFGFACSCGACTPQSLVHKQRDP
jgi:hypothetical protein